jgi:hypothetical protein
MSVPNIAHQEQLNQEDSQKDRLSYIDSEMIEDDSLVDFDQQVEEIHEADSQDLNFGEGKEEKLNADSFQENSQKDDLVNDDKEPSEEGLEIERKPIVPKIEGIEKIQFPKLPDQNENVQSDPSFDEKNSKKYSDMDTSGVTDIEMVLESHQDLLQYIHLLSQITETNFT